MTMPNLEAWVASLANCGFIEHWRVETDATHVLLKVPSRSCGCGAPHCWYVNRDGKTRCWECDQKYVKERDAFTLALDSTADKATAT